MINKDLENIINRYQLCTSCGLCQSVFGEAKIELTLKDNGYYTPDFKVNIKKDEEKLFHDLCPCLNMRGPKISKRVKCDSVVGNYFDYYNGYSTNIDIRNDASTGGGITSFCSFLLKEGYVDGVLHIGEGSDILKTEASISKTVEDIEKKMGSQYMPSSLLINIMNHLEDSESLAVVGRPCDIHAISTLIKKYPKYEKKIFIKIAFLCGGMPSLNSTKSLINDLGANIEEITSLKYRGDGWPGFFKVTDKENVYTVDYNEAWGSNLGRSVPLACKICVDSLGEYADIVFGDAWECDDKGFPIFSENEGNNLIITRNNKADNLLKLSVEKKYLVIRRENIDQFKQIQPSQTIRRSTSKLRVKAVSLTKLRRIKFNKEHIEAISQNSYTTTKRMKFFLGTLKRVNSTWYCK